MARAALETRVTICHFVWMANHLHMLLVVRDAEECKAFYGELQKKLTDYVKRLAGLSYLNLWDCRPMVATILDPEECKKRIAYYYSNPARAGLVASIDDYPGLSSWQSYLSGEKKVVKRVPWIQCPTIKPLKADVLSDGADRKLAEQWRAQATEQEKLIVEPDAWLKCFRMSKSEAKAIKASIIATVRESEEAAAKARARLGKTVIGRERLTKEAFYKRHRPSKNDRKIFVLSSIKDLRIKFIEDFKKFCDKCAELYAKKVLFGWPPGFFRPPFPPCASALA